MAGRNGLAHRLYSGEVSFDFAGRRKLWYAISVVIMLVAFAGIFIKGLNLGIEFRGGSDFTIPNATCSVDGARDIAYNRTDAEPIVTETGSNTVRVQTTELTADDARSLAGELADACGVSVDEVSVQAIGAVWGEEISRKAVQGILVFALLVALFLTAYFEWRMAVAALVALAHDIIATIGVYALTGLEVTPATAIGVLTILGYSLYDTVVVFDKVKENTRGITGQSVITYAESANLAINQTVVRSINTSVVAILPVLAVIGAVVFGFADARTLLDLTVALAIGTAVGVYSSIFIATPLLVDLKQRQPEIRSLDARVAARRAAGGKRGEASVAAGAADGDDERAMAKAAAKQASHTGRPTTQVGSGERKQPKRQSRSKRK